MESSNTTPVVPVEGKKRRRYKLYTLSRKSRMPRSTASFRKKIRVLDGSTSSSSSEAVIEVPFCQGTNDVSSAPAPSYRNEVKVVATQWADFTNDNVTRIYSSSDSNESIQAQVKHSHNHDICPALSDCGSSDLPEDVDLRAGLHHDPLIVDWTSSDEVPESPAILEASLHSLTGCSDDDEDAPAAETSMTENTEGIQYHHKTNIQEELHNSSVEGQESIYNGVLKTPLCQCSSITFGAALLMVLVLMLRHSLSWVAVVDILKLINVLFNKKSNKLPETKYMFQKHVRMRDTSSKFHVCCEKCNKYLGEREDFPEGECECGTFVDGKKHSNYFISLDLSKQLQNLFALPQVGNLLMTYRQNRVKENPEAYKDVYDGKYYKKLSMPGGILASSKDVGYTINTDGCQVGSSSSQTLWPIFIMLSSLPIWLRHKFILLAGVWVGKREPNMRIFLQPFIKEMNRLASEGLHWIYQGKAIVTKLFPLNVCVDSPARCAILNMMQYNGYFGCTFCDQMGVYFKSKGVRYTTTERQGRLRTHADIIDFMVKAMRARSKSKRFSSVRGVKGPSPLMLLKHLNLADGFIVDYMHAILLGVVRTHVKILMSSTGESYYIGSPSHIAAINQRLKGCKPPTSITWTPRGIDEMRLWKASEWRSWIVFYAPVVLKGILPRKYHEHVCMLSVAIFILLQKSILPTDLQRAQLLLLQYVSLYQNYFGPEKMVYNLHLLVHIPRGVENFGPLWTHNTFPFKNANRLLLMLTQNPKCIGLEIVTKYQLFQSIQALGHDLDATDNVLEFCEEVSRCFLKQFVPGDKPVLGCKTSDILSVDELYCLDQIDMFVNRASDVLTYNKVVYFGKRYTHGAYTRAVKSNDSFVKFKNGHVGQVHKICHVVPYDQVVIIVLHYNLSPQHIVSTNMCNVTHVRQCFQGNTIAAYHLSDIKYQCVPMQIGENNFLSQIPYGCYGD